MIGGKGYDVSKYGASGKSDSDIYWMDISSVVIDGQNQNYFWRVLMRPNSVKFLGKNLTISTKAKYVILDSRI
mgnify:CR=1 FL=1